MYPSRHRGFGALVLLVVLVLSGMAVLTTNAQAQGNQLVGLVYQCSSPATFIGGALVTLSDAQGIQDPRSVTTLADGTFTFSPLPGYYNVQVEKDGYFTETTASPIRFDDSATVDFNAEVPGFCLGSTPTADKTVSLLIVSQAAVHRVETVSFTKSFGSNENTAASWNRAGNYVTLARKPVYSLGITLRYERLDGTYSKDLANVTDYTVLDYFNGRIQINDPIIIADLDADPTRSVLYASYFSWTPSQRLQFYPVVPASYLIRKNGASWMARENLDWTLDIDTGILTVLGGFTDGTDSLSADYWSVAALAGARVEAVWSGEVVRTVTADASGTATLSLWTGVFEIRTTRSGYAPSVTSLNTGVTTETRIELAGGVTVTGHARDAAGRFLSAGLQGTLYNLNPAANRAEKVVPATVVGSLYSFNAPPGSYRMVIDANGYRAANVPVTLVGGTQLEDVTLAVSEKEEYRTTVQYGPTDWGNLTVYRNLTLNADSTPPGLSAPSLRDLRLQVDDTFGTGPGGSRDGTVNATEESRFRDWIVANGPLYVTTDGFLTTNGKAYRSALTDTVSVEGLVGASGKVWINTTTTYALKQTPPDIAYGATRYFVNVTTTADKNVSVLQDQVYVIALPQAYEMVSSTIFGGLTTDGYTRVMVDPTALSGTPQIRMTVEKAQNGSARARVEGPAGKFHVVNASFGNYQAYVAADTNLTFSARLSTDPNGDPLVEKANFTWKFKANTAEADDPANIRYGIEPYFTYGAAGEFTVNLTVRETGGNLTYRDIKVFVDDELPVARARTNRTGSGAFTGNLSVDEDVLVKYDGSLSTDLAYPGKNGVIQDGGYGWDFDGDRITDATGRVVNWSFAKPGAYTVNLTVTDSVGWKSANATFKAVVNDTTEPTAAFDIRDPSNEYSLTTTLTEGRIYSFNASRTTDNYDKPEALNYTWKVPGPIEGRTGKNHTFTGMNISFKWTEWNASYKVVLSVKDTGYGSGDPNEGNSTREIVVQVDTATRPDLKVDSGTMKIDNRDPEDGQSITITVNISNKANRGLADAIATKVYVIAGGTTTLVSEATTDWRDRNSATTADHTLDAGELAQLTFVVAMSGQGNKTVKVCVSDADEPYTWNTGENCASLLITVRQAGWVNLAVYGSIVGAIGLFVFYMYYRRKVRAGEWSGVRLRREKGEKGEAKPRKEVKEEKKRL